MKRTTKTVYASDEGRELITLKEDKASVLVCGCTADELDQLASACAAAAEELRSLNMEPSKVLIAE